MHLPLLFAALGAAPASAQLPDPNYPRIEALTKSFSRGRPQRIHVSPDGKTAYLLESGPRSSALGLFAYDVASGKASEVITPAEVLNGKAEVISVAEQARRERQRQTEHGFTSYALSRDGTRVMLPLSGKVYVLELANHKLFTVYAGEDAVLDPQLSPDGKSVAYVRSNDLFVADVATGKERRLTTGGTEDKPNGLAEFVAQEELRRQHGFWWAPDSKSLAFAAVDQTGVEHLTISDPAHPEQSGNRFAYPRAGKTNAKIRLALVAAAGGKPRWLDWDAQKFPYLTDVLWAEGRALPVLEVRSRDQRDLALLEVDAKGTRPFFHEHDDAWIDVIDESTAQLADGRVLRIAITPEGDALQVVALDGTAKLLLPASFGVRALLHADEKAAYVDASTDPLQSQIWRVPLDGSAPQALTTEPGEHHASFFEGAPLFAEQFSDESHMTRARLIGLDGKVRGELPSQAEAPPFTPNVEYTHVEADGRTYYAAIVRPHDFDPKKKYAVVDAVYGGPTVNVVARSMGRLLGEQWIADHGVIVVLIDNRGTPRRDRAWSRAVEGDFGNIPLADQVLALRALGAKYPELDLERVGVHGWSFGGYLSALAVLKRPDMFKVAVAGAPVVDWTDYDTAYTERYLRTPEANAKGYESSSLLTYAKRIVHPMLLVHGTADDNVYFFNSLKLMDTFFKNGQRTDFLPLIGQTHVVANPAVREEVLRRTAGYLVDHLGPPK